MFINDWETLQVKNNEDHHKNLSFTAMLQEKRYLIAVLIIVITAGEQCATKLKHLELPINLCRSIIYIK